MDSTNYICLDAAQIKNELSSSHFTKTIQLHLFDSIDSTNIFLKQLTISDRIDICLAESQTQGRGRFGRQWHAPFGENICCSIRWPFYGEMSDLSGLSLVISLAVVSSLKTFINSDALKIKWPNDILFGDKKLCGCLIESILSRNTVQVIVGIGLNANTDTLNQPLADRSWCSLFEVSGHTFNRNLIIASLIQNVDRYFEQFLNEGWEIFSNEWKQYDYLAGSRISIAKGLEIFKGLAQGVDTSGQLILVDDSGIKHYFSSGEATLHKDKNEI